MNLHAMVKINDKTGISANTTVGWAIFRYQTSEVQPQSGFELGVKS